MALTQDFQAGDIEGEKRLRRMSRAWIGDSVFRGLTLAFTLVVLLILGGVVIVLIDGAAPALHLLGLDFLPSTSWNPVTERYGALVPLLGPIATADIALLAGVPCPFAVAFRSDERVGGQECGRTFRSQWSPYH